MAEKLEQLGKYTLERRLAAGGMAEVFLATDASGRRCVIKRMLPNLLVDKQFARMFLDEAKLVVQLNHPAIAQIYDFGQDKGVLYLAMEWVDGKNLRAIVKDYARRGEKIPVEFCARLVAQAALALGYAHRAAGLDGKLLKIIHRDVSPQNILLGRTGTVKLIDFGVAKASSASLQTAVGMIKGKFAYMSPEQLRGDPLDGRSDIFGLGLVLYELLAAERAVPGASEAEIAQNALRMNFPPIKHQRPDLPAPLEAILSRALAADRSARYDTAEDLAAELETFITPRMPKLSGLDLAKLLPVVTAPVSAVTRDPGSDQKPVAFWEAGPTAPTVTGLSNDEATRLKPGSLPPGPVPAARTTGVDTADDHVAVPSAQFWNPAPYERVAKTVINPPGLVPSPVASSAPRPGQKPSGAVSRGGTLTDLEAAGMAPRSRLRWLLAATVAGFTLAALGWWVLQQRTRTAVLPVPPPGIATPAATPLAPAPQPIAPPLEAAAKAPVRAAGAARLTLTASVPARISVDGKAAGQTPLELAVPAGTHQLEFEDLASSVRSSRKIELKAGEVRTEQWQPERGRVVVRAVPWAEVFLGGKSLGLTPLEPISLLEGRHTFRFVNSETQRVDEQTIEVKAKLDTMVKVDLRSAP